MSTTLRYGRSERLPTLRRSLSLAVMLVLSCAARARVATPPSTGAPQPVQDPELEVSAVVLTAVGRTGSTLVSHLFGSIPGAFVLVEPYKRFFTINLSDPPVPPAQASGVQPPSLASLLDCSFASSLPVLNAIAWPFMCMHSSIAEPGRVDAFRARCGDFNAEDAADIRRFCLRARYRVVKTLRFSQVSPASRASLVSLAARPKTSVRILHVVRHPFAVTLSQYEMAWYAVPTFRRCGDFGPGCNTSHEPDTLTPEQVGLAEEHIIAAGIKVCRLMNDVTSVMRATLPDQHATAVVRYEDLAEPYTVQTFGAIAHFLSGPWLDLLRHGYLTTALADVTRKRHASFKIGGWEKRRVHTEAAARLGVVQPMLASAEECTGFYREYNYAPWPPVNNGR